MVPFNHFIQITKATFYPCLSQTTLITESKPATVSQATGHPGPTCPTSQTSSSDHVHVRSHENGMIEEKCLGKPKGATYNIR